MKEEAIYLQEIIVHLTGRQWQAEEWTVKYLFRFLNTWFDSHVMWWEKQLVRLKLLDLSQNISEKI